jgi:TolB-like protein/cytochrome c-type biogenesis protein CcmH/NrfG
MPDQTPASGAETVIYRFDDCVLDTERRELRRADALRSVEPQVFDLLEYLMRHRERVVGRDELLKAIWRGHEVSDAVLSTRINAARAAIGDSGRDQNVIRTFLRRGFRFMRPLRERKADVDEQTSTTPSRPRLALAIAGAPAIAVLPFAHQGTGPSTACIAHGLAEEIGVTVSKLGWLSVVYRHASLPSNRSEMEVQQLASALGVQYVLEGGVREAAGRVRIIHIWAERYERDLTDVLAVQDEIAAQVVKTIADQLYAAECVAAKLKPTDSLSLWEYLVRALSLMNTRRRVDLSAAESLLKKAIAIDPSCAPAFSLLSFAATLRVHLGWQLRSAGPPIALEGARKALALNPDEPWGHLALGYANLFRLGRPQAALESLARAIALDPDLSIAHYLSALASIYIGEHANALRHAQLAASLRPYDLLARGNAGAADNVRATLGFAAGRHQEGMEFARKAVRQSPRQLPAYRLLAFNCAFAGENEAAAAAIKLVRRSNRDTEQWIRDTATMWSRREDFNKYIEAYRLAERGSRL